MLALAVIYQVLQLLAGLEERNLFGGIFLPVPCLVISSHAGAARALATSCSLDLTPAFGFAGRAGGPPRTKNEGTSDLDCASPLFKQPSHWRIVDADMCSGH